MNDNWHVQSGYHVAGEQVLFIIVALIVVVGTMHVLATVDFPRVFRRLGWQQTADTLQDGDDMDPDPPSDG